MSNEEKISFEEKLCFGFGILANTILTGIVALYLNDYYINKIQIEYSLIFETLLHSIFKSLNFLSIFT